MMCVRFYRSHKILILVFTLFMWCLLATAHADVVKPALIEVNVDTQGDIKIEIRASIEALLTGINGKYKNTQDAPNAEEYDALRALESDELAVEFAPFKAQFLDQITLSTNTNDHIPLTIESVKIPEPGYTKVPRISLINLTGKIDLNTQSLQWYYPMAFGDNAVRLRQIDQTNQQWHWSEWQWLRKDKASTPFSLTEIVAQRPVHKVISEYIVIGFDHIIPKGLDHILFIVALFFFSTQFKPLFWQVTMFTIAHTITLGLSMNGMISLPASIVEPLIALSIAYAALENIFAKEKLHNSRLILVFAFGLLHGMGFASILSDFGMPDNAFITALISFNIGVELGQLAVIAGLFLLIALWFRNKSWYRTVFVIPISLVIAILGLYWVYERVQF
ncbi:MAG: membrane protein, putative [uncultured Thiotrichaceae bacterium]|uniref:Membrane protein, putative n=1 Tax=uncultured Thiotrichaceae bacterium TaxID=298394 RepID=A0A6S6T5K0_9GAMM|nr:MAG: membrane protein, putative [uncultured Thiotrichaceae bacterium]